MTKNIKVECKSSKLISILNENLKGKMNKARITFFGLFICALCKVQTVCYKKLADAFETSAKSDSALRRIQRFMAEYNLASDIIARLIFGLLPRKERYRLAMDRTNWKFGETNINVLTLAVIHDGVAFPLLISMLDKRGNSDTKERIEIIDRYTRLFGQETIDCLTADREFVGEKWIEHLNLNFIQYFIRIRENFNVTRHSKTIKASWLFSDLKVGEARSLPHIYSVNGQHCYLSGSKIKNSEGKVELQIIISFSFTPDAIAIYKQRWQIETAFRAMKSSGFNIEDTHLSDLYRIEKLFSLVMVAFAWAYVVGIYVNDNIKPIRIKNDGKRTKSLFKYGLETIANYLNNPLAICNFNIFEFLSCT